MFTVLRPSLARALHVSLLGLALSASGCKLFSDPNRGSGSHLDKPQEKPAKRQTTAKASTMIIDVTTDANNEVTLVQFVQSSGSNAVDGFVADSIRREWPGTPSTRARVEVSYEPATGFSQPKLLSSAPTS